LSAALPGWRRTGGCGRTASESSIPACSSSTWLSWVCYSGDREQALRTPRVAHAVRAEQSVDGAAHVAAGVTGKSASHCGQRGAKRGEIDRQTRPLQSSH
jgi:hypothetical protein